MCGKEDAIDENVTVTSLCVITPVQPICDPVKTHVCIWKSLSDIGNTSSCGAPDLEIPAVRDLEIFK